MPHEDLQAQWDREDQERYDYWAAQVRTKYKIAYAGGAKLHLIELAGKRWRPMCHVSLEIGLELELHPEIEDPNNLTPAELCARLCSRCTNHHGAREEYLERTKNGG